MAARNMRGFARLAYDGFRAGSSHKNYNAMSVFEPLRQPCAVLARSLRANKRGFR